MSMCPSCGSTAIEEVKGDWSGDFKGKAYLVKDLRYFHCPKCDENVYDREAMRKIQAASPAYLARRGRRKAA
jgi:YgiT-type zinc finger domain-containing protein